MNRYCETCGRRIPRKNLAAKQYAKRTYCHPSCNQNLWSESVMKAHRQGKRFEQALRNWK